MARVFWGDVFPSEIVKTMRGLSKFCLFLCWVWKGLTPVLVGATELSSPKIETIPKNMVWVDLSKGNLKSKGSEISGRSFWINKFEVTQKEFFAVMGDNPSFFKGNDRPVEKVTWFDANNYCKKTGQRLPLEWEWEAAARAGSAAPYYWKDQDPDNFAWHKGNAQKRTHAVGLKKPNALGIYDMAGNVWEWTFSDHESGGKAVRGGSWRNGLKSLKSSSRINSLPIHKFHYVGFRCVASEMRD